MKIFRVIVVIICLAFVISCSKEKEDISIKVKLDNYVDNNDSYLYLINRIDNQTVDSLLINDDTYEFSLGIPPYEEMFAISIGRNGQIERNFISFFGGKHDTEIEIIINKDNQENEDIVTNITGKGKEQIAYENYIKSLKPINDNQKILDAKWKKLVVEEKHTDPILRAPLDSVYRLQTQKYVNHYKAYVSNYQNLTALNLLNTKLRFTYDEKEIQNLLDSYTDAYEQNPMYITLKERIEILKNVKIGAIATDFTIPDVNDNPISLSSFRGKYVLVDFWASWCGPCRKENPFVVEAYDLYKEQGFEVLGVSYDYPGNKDKWLKAIKDDKLEWTQVSNLLGWKCPTSKMYNISGIPSPFLIDPEGKIIAKEEELREEKLMEKLSEIFDKNI